MSGKRYTDEFKIEAVKQVTERGHSVRDVAQRLGITTHSLYAWKLKFGQPDIVRQTELDQSAEVRRLKAELKRVTEERDILKNVWSAPDLQVAGLLFRKNNVCVNVSGLFAQYVTAGHDGIRAHQTQ